MTGQAGADGRVPGYLGRVLDGGGAPVGTCFQVSPGVLATAWHVLADAGITGEGDQVQVDALGGGEAFAALVARIDPLRDLAVLTCERRLAQVAGGLAAADAVALRALVSVTGHAVPDDPGHWYRFLVAPGEWAGGTTRDDAVPLGRVTSTAVVPGMSGAPVVRDGDGTVVGVVSGRYNSADGWLAGTVWVARAEDLAALLDGITDVTLVAPPLAGPADLLLEVTTDEVRLTGPGVDVTTGHGGVRSGLAEAVNEIRRDRSRAGLPGRADTVTAAPTGPVSLGRAGYLLGESFLPAVVRDQLDRTLKAAVAAHQPVRLGLAVPPQWAGLPWEALPGPDGRALALHPMVSVYRRAPAAAGRRLAGPLRVVVAIASPDTGGGPVLDYERELRNVLAAARAARADAADVRVVPFATVAAIRAELERGPAHVLHISGHGSPGRLWLEDEDGKARPVTADELVDEAVPAGRMPPVITLAACYTDAAATPDGVSFAARLCQRGACAVIATETSVTDTYATRLLARVYAALAQAGDPDVVAALSHARRQVQAELETSPDPRDRLLSGMGEWAAVTVLASSGSVPLVDPGQAAEAVRRPSRPRVAGLAGREDWYFVGRRAEQRRWPAELTSPGGPAGIVVCGIGGAGKTTLAAELVSRVRDQDPARILVSLAGPLTLETLLGTVTAAVRRELLARGAAGAADAVRALDVVARADVPWQDRYAILRGHVLDQVPVLVLLDNFEDNLRAGGASFGVADEALGGLLAAWAADPGSSRLLVTCRYQFTLPGGAHEQLSFRQLGPLSRAETMKLAWSLPALDQLDDAELERVWRLVGGHPRSLEYLDALLSGGKARYPDVTRRLRDAVTAKLDPHDLNQWLAGHASLDAALAETVTLAADDVLLGALLTRLRDVPGAGELLTAISVYREPVDENAVLFQAGQPDPDAEHTLDRIAAMEQITAILATAGITVDDSLNLAVLPAPLREELVPHLAELERLPAPPYRPRPALAAQAATCQVAGLVDVSTADDGSERFFVHRWTATELAGRVGKEPDGPLVQAHRQAAAYWRWRVRVWPQDKAADVHDLLEARYHLIQAADTEAAGEVTEGAVSQLEDWGAWDQEASLIHDTLSWLSADSPRQATWIHHLGILAQLRGDYEEAARQYQRSLDIEERLGNQDGMATSYSQLGILEKERGGQAATAITWHTRALVIRISLQVPKARIDLRHLREHRRELGTGPFTSLLASATGDPDLTQAITSLLDQLDEK